MRYIYKEIDENIEIQKSNMELNERKNENIKVLDSSIFQNEKEQKIKNLKYVQCKYYNYSDFINIKKCTINKYGDSIKGIVLPHHLLAKDLIHEVFQSIDVKNYKTVVLIGPDHESEDKGKIFSTLSSWNTPMGILETDYEIVSIISSNNFIKISDEKMTKEHSISGIVPFVKYYMQNVNVIPLAITKQAKLENIDKLIEDLSINLDIEKTLFIASVDFSHYLSLVESNEMDMKTMEAIKNNDIEKIMNFTNDNLDSPMSIVSILRIMDRINAKNQYILNRSNSDIITKSLTEETTSYITYLFY